MSPETALTCGFKALVIDDDFTVRLLVSECLSAAGFTVIEAENGKEGLALFSEHSPAVVLLDVMMPDISGYEVCAQIRALPQGSHVPILMLTGLEDQQSITQAYDAGATDFTIKPINWTLLAHRIHYLVRSHETVQRLAESQGQLAKAQALAKLGSWQWSVQDASIKLSKQAQSLLELDDKPKITVRDAVKRLQKSERQSFFQVISQLLRSGSPQSFIHQLILPSGEQLTVRSKIELQNTPYSFSITGSLQDITEHQQAQRQILQLSNYDPLTGLPNRKSFQRSLSYALGQVKLSGEKLAVLSIDLDNFKLVNSTLGHSAGDEMLRLIGNRLQGQLRRQDQIINNHNSLDASSSISRISADEFTVALPGIQSPEAAARVAQRLLSVLREPIHINQQEIVATASIGIALYPDHGDDVETLTQKAGTALHHAKSQGRDAFFFYSKSLNTAINNRLALENDLRQALVKEELELNYQPKLDIRSSRIIGAEALARWNHPTRGPISPMEFIPIAEDSGLIVPLGRWVLREACKQASNWHRLGFPLQIAVNVSPKQFGNHQLEQTVAEALAESGLPPESLLLEITESTIMSDAGQAIRVLEKLRRKGIQVAIDDFGTGHSSLLKLKCLPVDELKIDRGFISDVNSAADTAAIVNAIITMGLGLGQTIVAEGVETLDQLSFLRARGCSVAQGYLISRPIKAEQFAQLLSTWSMSSVA